MENCIVCNLALFSLHQKIYYVDENKNLNLIGSAGMADLPDVIIRACDHYGTNKVRLVGGGDTFAQNLSNEIQKIGISQYNKKIEIEVE